MKNAVLFCGAFAVQTLAAPFAASHEFWIEPEAYRVASGSEVQARLFVGEDFDGSEFSFNPRNFERFEWALQGDISEMTGRPGDRPAAKFVPPQDGLLVIGQETRDMHLTYTKFEKFEAFLNHKDWSALSQVHQERALPETGFRERYSRYVKALVAIGSGEGEDRVFGYETEIVALANPYIDGLETMPVQVLYQDTPRANAQVELFEKAPDGNVEITLHKTDASGIARLPVKPGHAYLADAVVIRAIEPKEERDPVWESLWAALTFALP